MKLYYHRTDGGAEYYSTTYVEYNGHREGTIEGVVMRTDGNEIEVFASQLDKLGIKLVIN